MVLAVSTALLGSGCAGNVSNDPHQGGFFGGLAGLSSGAYQKRVDDQQANLAAINQANQQLQVQQQQALAEEQSGKQVEAQLHTRLTKLDQDSRHLRAMVARLRAKSTESAQEIADLRDQTEQLNHRGAELREKIVHTVEEREALAQQIGSLEQKKEVLYETYQNLLTR